MSSLDQIAGIPVRTPLEAARGHFAIGIPTLGTVPIDLAFALAQASYPINFGPMFLTQNGWAWDWEKNEPVAVGGETRLPVADARNVIAFLCWKNNVEWLLFRDDDTIAPPETPNRLYTIARDCLDRGIPISCVGGNYMSKQFPPHSLILIDGHPGGYENWRIGELVEVSNEKRAGAIGMGCTLIHVPSTIAKTPAPWFKTVHSSDPNAKHFDAMAGRTIHVGNDIQDVAPGGARMTEDVYFCRKMRRYGLTHVYCDTSIQCQHVNISDGKRYYYHAGLGRGVMQHGSILAWHSRPGDAPVKAGLPHPMLDPVGYAKAVEALKKPDVVRFDLGTPGKKEGWITIDLFEKSADEQVDIHSLGTLVEKYGHADMIRASHILEHFPFQEIAGLLAEWVKALKPGGELFVEVPDAEWGCRNLLEGLGDHPENYLGRLYKLIGFQSNPGDFHKCLFMKPFLEYVLKSIAELEEIEVEFYEYPDPAVQRAIRARARRNRNVLVRVEPDSDIVRERVNILSIEDARKRFGEGQIAVAEAAAREAARQGGVPVPAGAGAVAG